MKMGDLKLGMEIEFEPGATKEEVDAEGTYDFRANGSSFGVVTSVTPSSCKVELHSPDGNPSGGYWNLTKRVIELFIIPKGDSMGKKFEVGDKVIGNAKAGAKYRHTTEGWRGVVTEVGARSFSARSTDGSTGEEFYALSPSCFDLLTPRVVATNGTLDLTHLDKVVMPEQNRKEIVSVLKQHKNAKKLFEDWGLGEVIEYGKGMTFLFYGPPGTGKTWAANCMAKAIGTQLLVVSAAEVQSSEPGGANRAIQQAFKEAKSSGKVLFLDECDSLVQSRTNLGMVLGSEVNTLLTEIEKFEGVAILATNMVENLDEALERRISLMVEFAKPKRSERRAIWDRLLPSKMPLGKDVDKDELTKAKLTGGQIKNVILNAARMAIAEDAEAVYKTHFDSAISRLVSTSGLMGGDNWTQDGKEDVSGGKSVKRRKAKVSKEKDEELEEVLA